LLHRHQYVEVNQAVVDRGNQSIGHAMGDQIEMLHATGRIDHDEVVFARAPNFPELRYELPQVSTMTQSATVSEIAFVSSANFLETRYEPAQGSAMHLFRNRIMIGQLQFLPMFPIPFTSIPEIPGEG
jgi:hypothetical protein